MEKGKIGFKEVDTWAQPDVLLKLERRRRIRIAAAVVPGFLGLLFTFLAYSAEPFFYRVLNITGIFVLFIGITLLVVSGASVLMIYLQTGFKRDTRAEATMYMHDHEVSQLRKQVENLVSSKTPDISKALGEIDSIKSEISKLTSSSLGVNQEQQMAILEELSQKIRQEATDSFISDIERKIKDSYEQTEREHVVESHFRELRSRLLQEIAALGRRGNLNLSLGIATTISGLFVLGVFVFSNKTEYSEWWKFTVNFVPRLTLVVFIETFAYFFLSLYRASLTEIKYFQNELTNVEAQCIALRTCMALGKEAEIKEVITKICCTERNFILSKNQTTVELERARLEKNVFAEATKLITSILPKKS